MKKLDFSKGWHTFLHWKGWRLAAAFCIKVWDAVIAWKGWRLPTPLLLVMSVLCTTGLIGVFWNGLETWVPAYFLYALSAYCLAALCVKLPAGLRCGKRWMLRHPHLLGVLRNQETFFKWKLYLEQFINFAYGIFKIVSGVVIGSAWVGSDGIYNMAQALIQLFQILRRKLAGTLEKQWHSYRLCGVLILLMHLTMTGIVFQMVNLNRAESQGEIMIIATAAFAFFKFISSFISIAKDRKHVHPVDSSVRMLKLSQAIFAIFSLQAAMLHTFGTGEAWEHWINLALGCTVCLLTVAMGIYMILRGNRELRKIQEREYGE